MVITSMGHINQASIVRHVSLNRGIREVFLCVGYLFSSGRVRTFNRNTKLHNT